MTPRVAFLGVLIVFGAAWAAADSIVIGGVMYDNVVVREGPSQYYVQLPADGRTLCVSKADVKSSDLVIGKDKAARQALLDEWAKNNALRPKPKATAKKPKRLPKPPVTAEMPSTPSQPAASPESGLPPTGSVASVKSAAGGSMVETGTFSDEKGVKRLVLKGNREKDVGIERRVEIQRSMERAAQRAAEEAAAEAAEQEMIAQEMAAEGITPQEIMPQEMAPQAAPPQETPTQEATPQASAPAVSEPPPPRNSTAKP